MMRNWSSSKAKQLLDTLNAMKPLPKESVLLEHRIQACEYGALLHNHARTGNSDVIQKAVECMSGLDIPLPTHVAAKLIERRAEEYLLDGARNPRWFDAKTYVSMLVVKPEFILPEVHYLKMNYATLVDMTTKRLLSEMEEAGPDGTDAVKELFDSELQASSYSG